jgi:hypothetical protein
VPDTGGVELEEKAVVGGSRFATYCSSAAASMRSPIGIRFHAAKRTLSHHCGSAGPLESMSLSFGAGVPIRFSGFVERGHEVIASGDGEARHAEDLRDMRLVPAVVQLFRYDLRTAAEDDVDSGQQRTSLAFT